MTAAGPVGVISIAMRATRLRLGVGTRSLVEVVLRDEEDVVSSDSSLSVLVCSDFEIISVSTSKVLAGGACPRVRIINIVVTMCCIAVGERGIRAARNAWMSWW